MRTTRNFVDCGSEPFVCQESRCAALPMMRPSPFSLVCRGLELSGGLAVVSDRERVFCDDYLAGLMKRLGRLSVSLAVVREIDEVQATALEVDQSNRISELDANTLFQAGSISKSVVAFATLRLVQEG